MSDRTTEPLASSRLRIGMLSTVPPTSCGIATFAAALAGGLRGHDVDVVHVDAGSAAAEGSSAVCALGLGEESEIAIATEVLNECDSVIVQHEYGIYPGLDGSVVLDAVDRIDAPIVVVAHTVLSVPSGNQHRILVDLCAAADVVVVMTDVARERLVHTYGVARTRVVVIAHGATLPAAGEPASQPSTAGTRMLTWGLLGPGKGIEWAIEAFARIAPTRPSLSYLIAGATHPNVKARQGERYRNSLIRRAARLGVGERVVFDDAYRSLDDLVELIETSDLVVLPYDSSDQVTSGVLVDAVAAGRPVVSTAFPHAVELLSSGAGLVVPQRDADALAVAIASVLDDPDRASAMAAEARRLAPGLSWPAVANRYVHVCRALCRNDRRVAS